jgi:hypothetical protein
MANSNPKLENLKPFEKGNTFGKGRPKRQFTQAKE